MMFKNIFKTTSNSYSILPGRNVNLFFSLIYLSLIVILPLGFLVFSLKDAKWSTIYSILSSQRVISAFYVSFSLSFSAAIIDLIAGTLIAWVLVKYDFFGRKILDSVIDLPFAMPTAVSGIALASIYSSQGWLGQYLGLVDLKVSYTPLGILVALIFIGIPFVVRALQPAIQALDTEMEEAAISLGANRMTTLRVVVFPQLLPSMLTGFTMSLARGLGEYGSVIFIAGNIPYVSEILPLLIFSELEQFDYETATVLAVTMLCASFVMLVSLGIIGSALSKRCHQS